MKTMFAILVIALLSPCAASRSDAGPLSEGPLHWTARHVKNAVIETGNTLSNVGRTAGRTIRHRAQMIHDEVE